MVIIDFHSTARCHICMLLIEDIYYCNRGFSRVTLHSPALGMTQARSSDQSPKADTEPEEVVRDEPELTGGRQPSLALTVRRGGQSKTPSLAISATWNLIQGLKCVKNGKGGDEATQFSLILFFGFSICGGPHESRCMMIIDDYKMTKSYK